MDLGLLTVERFIFQEVPRQNPQVQLTPTEHETEGDDALKYHIRTKIVDSLNRRRLEIIFSPDRPTATKDVVHSLLTGDGQDLILPSQELQRNLYTLQNGRISPGLLVVVLTRNEAAPGVALIKAEADEGVSLRPDETEHGRRYTVQHIKQLMFTEKTKLYKIGYFEATGDEAKPIVAYHADFQLGSSRAGIGADYFLGSFLGCKPAVDPAQITAQTWNTSVTYFNTIPDPETKVQYLLDLQSEMISNTPRFTVDDFARTHLRPEHRDDFRRSFDTTDVDPASSFVKDPSRIRSKLRRARMEFRSGLSLVGDQESFDAYVTQSVDDNGTPQTIITDRLQSVGGV